MSDAPKGWGRLVGEFLVSVSVGGVSKAIFAQVVASTTGQWAIAGAFGVLSAAFLYTRVYDRFLDRLRFQWQSAKWAGIAQVYPVAAYPTLGEYKPNYPIRDKAQAALMAAAESAQELRLLMVSGWRFIGCQIQEGLLLPGLEKKRGGFRLEVLLLNPDGQIAHQRADRQGFTTQQYADGVRSVLWTLARLRAFGYSVGAFFYEEEPIWQLAITDLEVWVLCASRQVATGASPVYCLKRKAPHGLAFGMDAVWERRRGLATAVDLDQIREPDWRALKALPPRVPKEN